MTTFYDILKDECVPLKARFYKMNKFEVRWHNEMEVVLVLEGKITLINDHKVYELEKDDIFIINSRELHAIKNYSEDNLLLIVKIFENEGFSCPDFKRAAIKCRSSEDPDKEKYKFIQKGLARIIDLSRTKGRGYRFSMMSNFYIILNYCMKNFETKELAEFVPQNTSSSNLRIQRILAYIDDNLTTELSLKEIAKRENLSIPYTSRFIKDQLGIPFQEYIRHRRLDKSLKLLLFTDKSITDIIYESGFPNSKSFYQAFRKRYSTKPAEYRRLYQEQDLLSSDFVAGETEFFTKNEVETALKSLNRYLDYEIDKKYLLSIYV